MGQNSQAKRAKLVLVQTQIKLVVSQESIKCVQMRFVWIPVNHSVSSPMD